MWKRTKAQDGSTEQGRVQDRLLMRPWPGRKQFHLLMNPLDVVKMELSSSCQCNDGKAAVVYELESLLGFIS